MKTNSKKCISGGQEREDRTPESQATFDPLSLEIKYPDTAIILLRSPERPILMAAAASLSRFGEKAKGNLQALFDLKVVDNILNLVEHEDLFTRRFALKLLALMSAVQNVQAHMLKTDFYIRLFIDMMTNEMDTFLQEFSSRILAELSSDPSGAAMILEIYKDFSFLFQKLEYTDPDIKRNSIEIINNLLQDLTGFCRITYSKDFSFAAIYELFAQPYYIIQQLALNVIKCLIIYNKDECIHEKFRTSGGVQSLFEILNHEDWIDLYEKILEILNLSCDNLRTAEFINKTDGVRQLFSLMECTPNEKLKFDALSVLIRLAETMNGRKNLYCQGLLKYLFEYLHAYNQSYILAIICEGLAKMTLYGPASDEILQENAICCILKLLNNKEAKWPERQAAAFALKELFAANFHNCVNFLEINGHEDLILLIQIPPDEIPWEVQVTVLEALTAIADYNSLAIDLIDFNLFSALCSILEPENKAADQLKIASCHALSRFPINEEARNVIIHVHALRKLYNSILESESIPVRKAATQLILILCADPLLANLFTQQGYFVYMLKNRSISRVIPTWNNCIEALLNADLPMKFAYTGQLTLRDITKNGFYTMRHSSCPFPVLEELFRLKLCPLELIYVVNFSRSKSTYEDDYCESKRAAYEAAKEVMRRESIKKGIRVSESAIDAWLELKFGRLQIDYDLIKYLEMFLTEIEVSEAENNDTLSCDVPGLIETGKIASRAQSLAKFVARQMSGMDSTNQSSIEEQLEIHLKAIRENIGTSIVPLGLLRVGSSFERSLLFKVMADRIALPASLVRGRYGKSWIEIAVPVIEKSEEDTNFRKVRALPGTYLHENFIVDLTGQPGDLIPINSDQGRKYYDARSCCEFACCR